MHLRGCLCLFRDVLAKDPMSGPNTAHVLPQIDPSLFPTLENTVLGTCSKDEKKAAMSLTFLKLLVEVHREIEKMVL